ncbi:polysaccharide deacetylase family protein [Candidatus Peregrinibacteria bacterium]|nr:polysaccharide deacetylase family protein [Candidatus Peregrinibacteria bacterium]
MFKQAQKIGAVLVVTFALLFLGACGRGEDAGKNRVVELPPKSAGVSHVKEIKVGIKIPILMYHYVRDVNKTSDPLGWNLSISPADFEKQIKYLKDNGYTPVHLSTLNDGSVKGKSIVLSFDDGTEDFYTTAFPILKKYGFTASCAIIADSTARKNYMTAEQIKWLIGEGIEVLSHGYNHVNLDSVGSADLKKQTFGSKDFLEKTFGIHVDYFVYPAGKYNKNVIDSLKAAGYKMALTTNYGEANIGVSDNFELPRIRIDNRDGYNGFIKKLGNL